MNETLTAAKTEDEPPEERLSGWEDYWYYGPVAMALFLVVWEVGVAFTGVPELFLPRPSLIVVTLYDLVVHKGLLIDLGVTLYRIFAGFAVSAVIGISLGLLMGTSKRIYAAMDIFVASMKSSWPTISVHAIPVETPVGNYLRASSGKKRGGPRYSRTPSASTRTCSA